MAGLGDSSGRCGLGLPILGLMVALLLALVWVLLWARPVALVARC